MGHFSEEYLFFFTLLSNNLPPGWILRHPNRVVQRPTGSAGNPGLFVEWNLGESDCEIATAGRTRKVESFVDLLALVTAEAGISPITDLMDRLEALGDASSSSAMWFGALERGAYGELAGDAPGKRSWFGQEIRWPYRRLSTLSVEQMATLAGISSNSTSIHQENHGLSVGDWIGYDAALGQWRKVVAEPGEPRCEGVVSLVLDDVRFYLVTSGPLVLTGHGWSPGPLYLSQTDTGVATSTEPPAGILRLVATVFNANELIVQGSQPEIER